MRSAWKQLQQCRSLRLGPGATTASSSSLASCSPLSTRPLRAVLPLAAIQARPASSLSSSASSKPSLGNPARPPFVPVHSSSTVASAASLQRDPLPSFASSHEHRQQLQPQHQPQHQPQQPLPPMEVETVTFGQIQLPVNQIFFSSQYTWASVNIKPAVPGHVILFPKRRVVRVADLTGEELCDLWLSAQKISGYVSRLHAADGISFVIQDGAAAGQTVQHVHLHVLPRKYQDFDVNDQIYEVLERGSQAAKMIIEADRKIRSAEDMASEANHLRQLLTQPLEAVSKQASSSC